MNLLMTNICYALCGFIFIIFLLAIMIKKTNGEKKFDEKVFIYQVASTIIFGLTYICFIISCIYFPNNTKLIYFLTKLYSYTLVLHESLIVTLSIAIVLKHNDELFQKYTQKKYLIPYYICVTILPLIPIILLKTDYKLYEDGIYHIHGDSMKFVFIYTFITVASEFLILLINRKKIKEINIIPLAILMLSYIIFVRKDTLLNQNFDAACMFFAAIDFVFYMTIENKDLMLINDYDKKKVLLDEKTKLTNQYMVNISNKIRTPLCTAIGNLRYLKDNKDIEDKEIKNMIKDINESCNNLYSNVLNSEVKINE